MTNALSHAHHQCRNLASHPELTLLLDLDGTLVEFAATTEAATLDDEIIHILDDLRAAGVRIVIVSGRPRALVDPLLRAVTDAWWVAEHGSWRCDHTGVWSGPLPAPETEELGRVLEPFTRVAGARLESKSMSLCLHWRLVPPAFKDKLIAAVELACDEWLEAHPDFERVAGVEMLEVRRSSANKGAAVAWVRQRLPGARIIAIGDDVTDEDMFAALRDDEISIAVGPRRSVRSVLGLASPSAVRAFLRWLIEARTSGSAEPFLGFERRVAPARQRARLVVVSNRIPPPVRGRERPVGGLVSALEPALRAHDGVWLGWSGHEAQGVRAVTVDDASRPVRAAFDFAPGWRDHFYGGLCNRALWPLFHGFLGRIHYSDSDWAAYVAANAEFARHAHELVTTDGTVWAHDYHLLLIGRSLRQQGFRGRIGLFLHIPFPAPELFDTLPWADELIDALHAVDVLGVHTEQWAANFSACARARHAARRFPDVVVAPIGVDTESFGASPPSADIVGLQAALGDRRLILGVDRLDYAKGIPERLLAFERLLETRPEWRARISFVQVSVPSREGVPEYAELRHTVELLVGRINGRFGEADWVPVRYLYRSYDQAVLAQLYRAADVALVTPLRDGLNLVAKEFVVAQDPARPGVLVLSRFAGAAAELTDALITNPYHADGLASDIDRALHMGLDERMRRHGAMMRVLAGNTPQQWASAFIERVRDTERFVA